MKVLLKEDVKKLGRKGDIVDVADGYASSALIPSGKAEVATPSAQVQVQKKDAQASQREKDAEKEAFACAAKLKGATVTCCGKAEGEKLFGSVSAQDIAQAIKSQYNVRIEASGVGGDHLKELGSHTVEIDCGYGAKAEVIVEVSRA